jgi:hypothetical protein
MLRSTVLDLPQEEQAQMLAVRRRRMGRPRLTHHLSVPDHHVHV